MSHSAVQRLTQTRAVTSAIVVTAAPLFTHQTTASQDAQDLNNLMGPLTRIAGLTLFQRSLLTLQRCGLSQVFVLCGEEAEALKAVLSGGPPITLGIRWIPVREFPPDDPRTWETLAVDAMGACLMIGPQAVFSRGLIESLRGLGHVDDLVVVVREGGASARPANAADRHQARTYDSLVRLASRAQGPTPDGTVRPAGVASEVMLVPAGGFAKGGPLAELLLAPGRADQVGETPMARLVEAAATEGRVSVVTAQEGTAAWAGEVSTPHGARRVEGALYRSLKSHFEGFVDTYFNRRLSPLFTKLFLSLNLSPNAVTVVATAIGLLSALCFARGTYWAGLIGALLFQWSAVIDCCDGEVARLTFTESPFGAKLDLWLDNVVHVAIFAALAYGAYHHPPQGISAELVLWGGVAAVAANVVSFFAVTRLAARQQEGMRSPWIEFLLKHVATRDFSFIVLVCAVLGQLPWFLMLAAVGSVLFALLSVSLLAIVSPVRE